jgi:hypothetical protein
MSKKPFDIEKLHTTWNYNIFLFVTQNRVENDYHACYISRGLMTDSVIMLFDLKMSLSFRKPI